MVMIWTPDSDEGEDDGLCEVYWGSHGCDLKRGHQGPCICQSCWDPEDTDPAHAGYVGAWPYYGPETRFWGKDAEAKWGRDRMIADD